MNKIDGIPIKEGTKNEVDLDAFQKQLEEAKKEPAPTPAPEIPQEQEEELYEDDDGLVEEEEVKENKKQKSTDYSQVVEAMPELKQDLDYLLIMNKIKEGQKLSKKELEFKEIYEEAKRKEAEFEQATQQKELEETIRQKEMQEMINREYEEYKAKHPETIETYDDKALTLKGSDNFLKVALTFMELKKSKKKGGKIFIKVARPKKVSIEWTTKDIRFVEFWSTNERGDKVKEVSRVNQYEYTFEGTSIPVIFAIQGFAEAWDFYSEFKKDLSSEVVSGIAMEAYNTGYKDGLVVSDKNKKSGLLSALTEFMPLILIGGLLVLGWLMYQMYGDMTHLYNTVLQMQTQMNTLVPTIDANAVIYR
jgi:hypothetical protein